MLSEAPGVDTDSVMTHRDHVWGLGNVTRLIREGHWGWHGHQWWVEDTPGVIPWLKLNTNTYFKSKHYQNQKNKTKYFKAMNIQSITRMLSKCSRNYLRMLMGLQMQIESFRTKRTNVMIVGAKKVVIILTKKLLKLIWAWSSHKSQSTWIASVKLV